MNTSEKENESNNTKTDSEEMVCAVSDVMRCNPARNASVQQPAANSRQPAINLKWFFG